MLKKTFSGEHFLKHTKTCSQFLSKKVKKNMLGTPFAVKVIVSLISYLKDINYAI